MWRKQGGVLTRILSFNKHYVELEREREREEKNKTTPYCKGERKRKKERKSLQSVTELVFVLYLYPPGETVN